MAKVKPPENPEELRRLVSPEGLKLSELEEILELELNGSRRRYIVERIISRINSLRATDFYDQTIKKLLAGR